MDYLKEKGVVQGIDFFLYNGFQASFQTFLLWTKYYSVKNKIDF